MTLAELTAQRLHNQYLLDDAPGPLEVLRSLTAIQSQDFVGGKWAIGLRCKTTDAAVQKLYNEGKILRTHILRPTWHFVAPEDIRWIQELTASRIHGFSKYYYKKVGLDELALTKSKNLLKSLLRGGNQLTRPQLAKAFADAGQPEPDNLRFGFIIMHAELEALICSGAMQGKQHTYVLVEERAPQAKSLPRDKALAELTRRYFAAHGPAQIADFAWWSSLTIAEVKQGIALAKLKALEVDGKTYYYTKQTPNVITSPIAHLLPNYDEYFIGHKDRSAFSPRFKISRRATTEDMSYHLLAIDGQMAGGWKRQITRKAYNIQLKPFITFTAPQQKALQAAIKRLGDFTGLPVALTMVNSPQKQPDR